MPIHLTHSNMSHIYVDDALFVYRSPEEVDILTKKMKDLGILFEEESDVAGYLGVLIDQDPDNDTITLRQSGLAQRIVEALQLNDDTPSQSKHQLMIYSLKM